MNINEILYNVEKPNKDRILTQSFEVTLSISNEHQIEVYYNCENTDLSVEEIQDVLYNLYLAILEKVDEYSYLCVEIEELDKEPFNQTLKIMYSLVYGQIVEVTYRPVLEYHILLFMLDFILFSPMFLD